jgi:hypothetical protein
LIRHDHAAACARGSGRSAAMTQLTYRSSRPDGWILPRPHSDPSLRRMKHGPIRPMHEPGLFERLFGRS